MLRITDESDPPIPRRVHSTHRSNLERENASGVQDRRHLFKSPDRLRKVAQKITVVNDVVLLGEWQFFKEATTDLHAERPGNVPGPFGIGIHTGNFVARGPRLPEEVAFTTSDFQESAGRLDAAYPASLELRISRIEAGRMPVVRRIDGAGRRSGRCVHRAAGT